MFERFTDRGRKIIILAREEAERHQNDYLGTEHLVLAILRESDGIALMIIKKMGSHLSRFVWRLNEIFQEEVPRLPLAKFHLCPRVKKVIEYGVEEARLLGHNHIGSEHLLLGLLRGRGGNWWKGPSQSWCKLTDCSTAHGYLLAQIRFA